MDADLYQMTYFATFFSHFGAMRYQQLCREQGIECRGMPVPRNLSSSCGTCVRYEAEDACLSCMDADVDKVYLLHGSERDAELLFENET